MKTYLVGESSTEKIEFRANENTYALVHKLKKLVTRKDDIYKTIILNKRELMILYMAIQDEIQKR